MTVKFMGLSSFMVKKNQKNPKQFTYIYSESAISSTLIPRGKFAMYHEIIDFMSPAEIAFLLLNNGKKILELT